jgi:hypothetical protein
MLSTEHRVSGRIVNAGGRIEEHIPAVVVGLAGMAGTGQDLANDFGLVAIVIEDGDSHKEVCERRKNTIVGHILQFAKRKLISILQRLTK